MISDRIYIRRYTTPNEKFEYGYPHSNVLFNLYTSKTLYFVQNVSFVSDVNRYVDQSLATLLLTQDILSQILDVIQSDGTLFTSALECVFTHNILIFCSLPYLFNAQA